MAAWLFSFSNDAKSEAGYFKDFHLGKAYQDVRQIIIQKVPHRIITFTLPSTIRAFRAFCVREFTPVERREPLPELCFQTAIVELLTLRANCSLFAPKPAQPSRFLPLYDRILIRKKENNSRKR